MEAAIFKPKPRMRAAVRDGLNRFQLVDKMETADDKHEGTTQLKRLALVSRAHLTAVRRLAAASKFILDRCAWRVNMELGIGASKSAFSADQTEMRAIIELLGVPVYLKFGCCIRTSKDIDWHELQQIGKYDDYSELNRHKIRRLDVPVYELDDYSGSESNQVISASIKSLGILHISDWAAFPYDSIEAFSRRFPSLEDLHIVCKHEEQVQDLRAYLKALWTKCLEIRDRMHVAPLKRLFITIKHDCSYRGTKSDWFKTVKRVEPFDKATVVVTPSKKRFRMLVKHNEPRGPKPTFICIKGDFEWWYEYEETDEGSTDSSGGDMEDEDENEDEAMEEDKQLDDSSEDAMDESESTDEDGVGDAGGH
ncbi:hypothetical protein M3Y99_00457000 [Aphelenchoides fujianensis]|nr:hypothetical protein M3Y99_00457000 [Aphelenchoides fujianensis]